MCTSDFKEKFSIHKFKKSAIGSYSKRVIKSNFNSDAGQILELILAIMKEDITKI